MATLVFQALRQVKVLVWLPISLQLVWEQVLHSLAVKVYSCAAAGARDNSRRNRSAYIERVRRFVLSQPVQSAIGLLSVSPVAESNEEKGSCYSEICKVDRKYNWKE
mmetsp:Transcript_82276/g.172266  ORF Transcript_82276/g.172266 Transcript_82276/m.172266 type:complete len:107 (+) Transcript_82276:2491-2811(+)